MRTKTINIIYKATLSVALISILINCNNKKSDFHLPYNESIKEREVILSNLKNISRQDSIIYKNETIYLDNRVFIKGAKDLLVILNKKIIYLLDNKFKVLFKLDFRDNDYLLNGPIRDIDIYDNRIYLLDSNSDIIIYDLNDSSYKKITVDKKIFNEINFRTAINISVLGYDKYLLTNIIVPRDNQLKKENILLGIVVDAKGKLVRSITFKCSDSDYEQWNLVGDRIFARKLNNTVVFSFWLTKTAVVYNYSANTYFVKELKVDSDWEKPKVKGGIIKMGEGIYAEEILHQPVNLNGLQVGNKQIFQIINRHKKSPIVVQYDSQLNEIESKEFIDTEFMIGDISKLFMIHLVQNRIILQSANELYHYE